MKRIFTYLFSLTLLASTSFSFISCDDDDVETVMQIITALLTNGTADLDNTAWAQQSQDGTYIYAFMGNQKGKIYLYKNDKLVNSTDFTYAYDASQNVLTLAGQSYTVQSFTAGSQMVLVDGNNTQYVFTSTQMPSDPATITALLTNGTADLENTAWYWQDAQKNGQVFAFKTGGQGVLYTLEKDVFTRADNFTYSYDSNQNVLTIAGVQYTVKSFTANQSLTLATNSGDVVLALADINSLPTVEQVNGTSNDDTDIAAMWAGTMWAIPVSESEYYVYSFETATTGKLYLTDANLDVKNQVTFTYQFGKVNDQYVFNIVRSDGQTETWVYVGLNEKKTQLTVKEGDGNTYTYTKAQSK